MLIQRKKLGTYIGMTDKADRLNLRIREDIKRDLMITAELRGLTMSGLINSLIVRAIREEKDRDLKAL